MADDNLFMAGEDRVDVRRHRFPHCVVWTPIPCITWLFPIIGHMGIATSDGTIRDFAGSYFVSEDNMAFGWPTRYWQLSLNEVVGGASAWDKAVSEASEEYNHRVHILCWDNCHSHTACALNRMRYGGKTSWNMISLCFVMAVKGRCTSVSGLLKQWLPFLIILAIVVMIVIIIPVTQH